jgi:hypothetical protein
MIGPLLFTQVFALAVHHGGESVLGAPFLLAAALLTGSIIVGTYMLPRRT